MKPPKLFLRFGNQPLEKRQKSSVAVSQHFLRMELHGNYAGHIIYSLYSLHKSVFRDGSYLKPGRHVFDCLMMERTVIL